MNRPIAESDIIFPTAASNINSVISELQRNDRSVKNRLHSIVQDAKFVSHVAAQVNLPLIANERCGSWYIRQEDKAGSAYFKSTDGHFGQWSFSLRRLNLHLLDTIDEHQGCIIVDSTRRGKSMPDALSKTVPVWIAVLNRILFPGLVHNLATPSDVVSPSEHAQIEARLAGFVDGVLSLKLDIQSLQSRLKKPLRPVWITPDAVQTLTIDDEHSRSWPVVLCTASSRASLDASADTNYVQGAADDHESWASGLTAVSFWQHKDELLQCTEDEMVDRIAVVMQRAAAQSVHRPRSLIKPTTQVFITSNASILAEASDSDFVVSCSISRDVDLEARLKERGVSYVQLNCAQGKNGSRQLRSELDKLEALDVKKATSFLCACPSGRDLAVGIALAILCRYHSADGERRLAQDIPNKAVIKQKLSWIMVSMPDAAPSRATLQAVNAFLMR